MATTRSPAARSRPAMSVRITSRLALLASSLVEMSQQRRGLEGVDAGVDLAQRVLRGGERLLLDDGLDLGLIGRFAHDAAVAGGVGGRGGQDGHRRLLGLMELPEPLDGLRADQRHVAGEHQNVLVAGDGLAGALDGVAGAALLGLLDEANAGGGHRGLHPSPPGGR
jgi:hypothetical protein